MPAVKETDNATSPFATFAMILAVAPPGQSDSNMTPTANALVMPNAKINR